MGIEDTLYSKLIDYYILHVTESCIFSHYLSGWKQNEIGERT